MSNWKSTKCCGTCALWDSKNATTASGAVRGYPFGGRCNWESSEPKPTALYPHMRHREIPGFISRDHGTECPCYIKREV